MIFTLTLPTLCVTLSTDRGELLLCKHIRHIWQPVQFCKQLSFPVSVFLSCPLYHADWLFYLWQIHFSSSPSIVNLQAFCDIAQQFQVFSLTWYFFHCPSILQQTFSFAKLVWMWTILTAGNPRNKFYLCPALCLHAQYMTFGVTHSLKDVGFLAENWWCTRDFARYCYKTFSILVH